MKYLINILLICILLSGCKAKVSLVQDVKPEKDERITVNRIGITLNGANISIIKDNETGAEFIYVVGFNNCHAVISPIRKANNE